MMLLNSIYLVKNKNLMWKYSIKHFFQPLTIVIGECLSKLISKLKIVIKYLIAHGLEKRVIFFFLKKKYKQQN